MIIEASSLIVHVSQLRNVNDSLMCHFQARHHHSHVIGNCEVFPVFVLQILLLDLSKQACVHGSEVACDKGILAICIFFHGSIRKRFGIAQFSLLCEEIGVDYPSTGLLIDCVVQFQDLSADQFIISINYDEDLLRQTLLKGCLADIPRTAYILSILNNLIMFWLDLGLFLKVGLDLSTSSISRCVVYYNYMVIFVILHDDGLNVAEMPMSVCIVESRNDNTEREFFIFTDAVFLLVVRLLFVG